ncbi:ABC transporter substrate-binding protein [Paenibacillus eucommiae]|uniref:Iron complex transport system substrate-binding protein n=1 Tax=Paenibacillus eucommiae TaxID=1355755 RepID=A0ABS4J000_9BACL|nr:ABC transporter substrate-binding protein [Paenibacillus eucommiae]MBP1993172.1 iron complex transport system substrate-binding protein [Paenibacillus eucommiae]
MRRLIALLLVTALVTGIMAGCGAMAMQEETGDAAIAVVDFAQRKIGFDQSPERIVALGNGEVDIIYALGGEVVGRPQAEGKLVNEAAGKAEEIGSVHTVDLERIAALKPDVVLGNYPINVNDVPLLEGIGVKVVLTQANSIDDIRRQIQLFAAILGREERADELVAEMDTSLLQSAEQPADEQRVLLVYGAPGTYLAALPNSLAGNILEEAGGTNVASQFPSMQNFPQYAQLNTERIVQAAPDIILIMTHGSTEEVEAGFRREMESNSAWSSLEAVRDGRIHVLPAELFGTNPGTRVAQAVLHLRELLWP